MGQDWGGQAHLPKPCLPYGSSHMPRRVLGHPICPWPRTAASWPWGPGEKMWNVGAAGTMNPGINVAKARSWSLKPENVRPQINQVFQYVRWQATWATHLWLHWIFCSFVAISKAWVPFIKDTSTIRSYGSDKKCDWIKIFVLWHAESQHRGLLWSVQPV